MKRILVNMNRSGYFWHELDNTSLLSDNPVVKMKREISEDSHPSITAMRTYEQFNYLFMKGNGDYILSIRNLNDPRIDGSGRNLKQHVIFEDEDKDLLLKMLAYYLTQPAEFEKWITNESFKPGQNDALCKLATFNKKIEELKKAKLNPILKDCEFAISSLKSAEWLQEKLHISGVCVADYLNMLDALRGETLLTGNGGNGDGSGSSVNTDTAGQTGDAAVQPQNTAGQAKDTADRVDIPAVHIPEGTDSDRDATRQVAKIQQELKMWKWRALALAALAAGSILALLYKCN